MNPDPIVESVRAKLLARSEAGIRKYGTTLEKAGLSRLEVLVHAQQEALDLANYLQVLIQSEEQMGALLPPEATTCEMTSRIASGYPCGLPIGHLGPHSWALQASDPIPAAPTLPDPKDAPESKETGKEAMPVDSHSHS